MCGNAGHLLFGSPGGPNSEGNAVFQLMKSATLRVDFADLRIYEIRCSYVPPVDKTVAGMYRATPVDGILVGGFKNIPIASSTNGTIKIMDVSCRRQPTVQENALQDILARRMQAETARAGEDVFHLEVSMEGETLIMSRETTSASSGGTSGANSPQLILATNGTSGLTPVNFAQPEVITAKDAMGDGFRFVRLKDIDQGMYLSLNSLTTPTLVWSANPSSAYSTDEVTQMTFQLREHALVTTTTTTSTTSTITETTTTATQTETETTTTQTNTTTSTQTETQTRTQTTSTTLTQTTSTRTVTTTTLTITETRTVTTTTTSTTSSSTATTTTETSTETSTSTTETTTTSTLTTTTTTEDVDAADPALDVTVGFTMSVIPSNGTSVANTVKSAGFRNTIVNTVVTSYAASGTTVQAKNVNVTVDVDSSTFLIHTETDVDAASARGTPAEQTGDSFVGSAITTASGGKRAVEIESGASGEGRAQGLVGKRKASRRSNNMHDSPASSVMEGGASQAETLGHQDAAAGKDSAVVAFAKLVKESSGSQIASDAEASSSRRAVSISVTAQIRLPSNTPAIAASPSPSTFSRSLASAQSAVGLSIKGISGFTTTHKHDPASTGSGLSPLLPGDGAMSLRLPAGHYCEFQDRRHTGRRGPCGRILMEQEAVQGTSPASRGSLGLLNSRNQGITPKHVSVYNCEDACLGEPNCDAFSLDLRAYDYPNSNAVLYEDDLCCTLYVNCTGQHIKYQEPSADWEKFPTNQVLFAMLGSRLLAAQDGISTEISSGNLTSAQRVVNHPKALLPLSGPATGVSGLAVASQVSTPAPSNNGSSVIIGSNNTGGGVVTFDHEDFFLTDGNAGSSASQQPQFYRILFDDPRRRLLRRLRIFDVPDSATTAHIHDGDTEVAILSGDPNTTTMTEEILWPNQDSYYLIAADGTDMRFAPARQVSGIEVRSRNGNPVAFRGLHIDMLNVDLISQATRAEFDTVASMLQGGKRVPDLEGSVSSTLDRIRLVYEGLLVGKTGGER
ncbi:unnamed protein product [Amoebophrya sp. A25]|nr:unnamed protein product [Amoebophrya sp. A25]|eukprot:GSA25T00006083001.1